MRAALTMLGIIIGVGCESHGRPWTRSRSLCSSPDYESRDQFVNCHPGRDDRQRRADWISGVSTLTVDDAHEIERRVSNITRVSFASRVVLQATHENKNWSTVVLDASNAGIARNCWVLSPVNAQHCVSLRRLCQDEFKTCLVTLGGKHSTADVCKEGELTMVTSGPFPPGRSFRPDPPLPPDPSPFPGPPLPEPTPTPEPPPVPDPSPFPGPPPHMRSEGDRSILGLCSSNLTVECRRSRLGIFVSIVETVHGTRWKVSSRSLPRRQVRHENHCRHA